MTITSIGIIGAGTMGNGIAQVAASAGYDVVLAMRHSRKVWQH
ncbi:MAG: 3-hydroxyacyl-CoA dehydrogenase, binding domain [Pseudomonadota bacterium]